jgi:hypothetical protein
VYALGWEALINGNLELGVLGAEIEKRRKDSEINGGLVVSHALFSFSSDSRFAVDCFFEV